MSYIGERIRVVRTSKGLRQYKVASAAQICNATMNNIETGHRLPGYIVLLKIANALGTTIDNLVSGDEIGNY